MPSFPSLTKSVIILHCFSFFVASLILALSCWDCGIISVCMNPLFAILTMGYHTTMLLIEFRRPDDAPNLSVGYTITAYLLSCAWLGAYIAMAIILSSRAKEMSFFDLRIEIPQTRVTQKIQIMLDPLECVIIGNIAVKSTIKNRRRRNLESKEAPPSCN